MCNVEVAHRSIPLMHHSERIRVCSMVINNDFHHPVHLAMEYADVDHLSGGCAELGIGAGHSFPEYSSIGHAFDPPQIRKQRMAEPSRSCAGCSTATRSRTPASTMHSPGCAPSARCSTTFLSSSASTAAPRWRTQHRLDATVAHIASKIAGRACELDLNVLVQAVVVTDDRVGAAESIAAEFGLTVDDALTTPSSPSVPTNRSLITSANTERGGAHRAPARGRLRPDVEPRRRSRVSPSGGVVGGIAVA